MPCAFENNVFGQPESVVRKDDFLAYRKEVVRESLNLVYDGDKPISMFKDMDILNAHRIVKRWPEVRLLAIFHFRIFKLDISTGIDRNLKLSRNLGFFYILKYFKSRTSIQISFSSAWKHCVAFVWFLFFREILAFCFVLFSLHLPQRTPRFNTFQTDQPTLEVEIFSRSSCESCSLGTFPKNHNWNHFLQPGKTLCSFCLSHFLSLSDFFTRSLWPLPQRTRRRSTPADRPDNSLSCSLSFSCSRLLSDYFLVSRCLAHCGSLYIFFAMISNPRINPKEAQRNLVTEFWWMCNRRTSTLRFELVMPTNGIKFCHVLFETGKSAK